MPMLVPYAARKEVTCTDSKLIWHPKNMPGLSRSRTQRALRFRGFLGVLRGYSSAMWEARVEGDKR
jgi:hypothetical protein